MSRFPDRPEGRDNNTAAHISKTADLNNRNLIMPDISIMPDIDSAMRALELVYPGVTLACFTGTADRDAPMDRYK